MRVGALLVFVAVLSGCASLGARTVAPAPALQVAAPALGAVALEPGELVARNETGAELLWSGALAAPALTDPLLGEVHVGDAPERATLRLPTGAPLRVEVVLAWSSRADLDLRVADDERLWCASSGAESDPVATGPVEERCVAWAVSNPAAEWTIEVYAASALEPAAAFEVRVLVSTFPPLPRYDITKGPPGAASVPDPTIEGPFEVESVEYDFGAMSVDDRVTGRPYPVRLLGVAHFPAKGEGPFPLVLLLHGRHASCEDVPFTSHCRLPGPADRSIRSYHGYDDAALLLASHGYVVASIDANDINALDSPGVVPRGDDGMDARAQLLLRTLDELRGVHERGGAPTNPALDPLAGRIDLERIGMMGHSRGAEGVTRAPSYAEETGHWSAEAIRAVYSLAGTTRAALPDPLLPPMPARTAYASVVPYCDGDVYTLGNYDFFDAYSAQPDHGVLVNLLFMGANHDFYNSAWPQDDAAFQWLGDAACGPLGVGEGRLEPADQRRHQLVYLPAFFRAYLGGETALEPLFTGTAAPPASACPEGIDACPGLVRVSYRAPGDLALPLDAGAGEGFDAAATCDPREGPEEDPCAWPRAVGIAPRLRLAWTHDAIWRAPLDGADLRAASTLAVRIGVDFADDSPPGGTPPRATLVLEDARGERAEAPLPEGALFVPPGAHARRITMDQARVPLAAFDGVDLGALAAAELRLSGATPGAVHVADLVALP